VDARHKAGMTVLNVSAGVYQVQPGIQTRGDRVQIYRAIGLMSGTSLDGVDVALLETDGESVKAFGPSGYRAYRAEERTLLREALADAADMTDRTARPGCLARAEALVTAAHAEAVEAFLHDHTINPASIDVIGFHGQTVLHRPQQRLTVQIGDGAALAKRLGIAVVYDFRTADVAAGGQGAPLVPVYHRALANALELPHPVAVLNIGGVSNITVIDGWPDPFACDVGPGNALLDDFMGERTGHSRDPAGVNAAQGQADERAVARVLEHPFFAAKPPKSLDRNDFRQWVHDRAALSDKSVPDGAATLTAITAASVAAVVPHLPKSPQSWIVCGGGAHNVTMMRYLSERLAPARVVTGDSVGWNSDALEAQAFAYLAARHLRGLPLTFPTTTGVTEPKRGGVLVRPR
jgi:anhydro-N-acetylmuramic acid kinase